MSREKERLDRILVKYKNIETREKAKALIMEGMVYVNGQKCDKPGINYDVSSDIEIRGKLHPYVSRGGLKLEKAINLFSIDLKDKICMDVGASTGGFTDCMLQNGAKKIYSVDVGYGQLDWKLRNNDKVVNLERTNIRNLSKDKISEDLDFFSMDVSFISIKLCVPNIKTFLRPKSEAVCLIKPQFEAGRDKVGKNGVVRDPQVHADVLKDILGFFVSENFLLKGLSFSPIKGPKGNIEYLAYLEYDTKQEGDLSFDIEKIVKLSHKDLNGERV